MKTVKSSRDRVRRWRENNPKRYAYLTLKANAKRRGKEFTITYEEFLIFCYRYKYIGKKGRTRTGYGVDRYDETKGYTLENMRLKKNGNNTRKYKAYDLATRTAMTVTAIESETENVF